MRYLGLDLGTKTLGIAISDKTNALAYPLTTLRFKENESIKILEDLVKIINENKITELALGLPKNMDNSLGFAADRSYKFYEVLKTKIDLPITMVDERLSSVEAHNILITVGKKNQDRKKIVDGVAATIILENFLKMKGNK